MRRVKASGIKLPFLSEPAELRFDHSLISAERGQVEEVKTLSRLSCRRQNNIKIFREMMKPYTGKAQAFKQTHSRARLRLYALIRILLLIFVRPRCKLIGRYSRGTAATVASHLYR